VPGGGAAPAGPIPKDVAGEAFQKGVGAGIATSFTDLRTAAQDASASIAATQQARQLLDKGMITGFGANFRVGFGKALQFAGIHFADDAIANSEAFVATRAQEVGRLIKLFGAGTGLSDADRVYAEKAAGGTIELNEESIRRILDMNEAAARNVLARYNTQADQVEAGRMPDLTITAPGGPGAAPTLPDPLGIR
jgi:hypothetical protein